MNNLLISSLKNSKRFYGTFKNSGPFKLVKDTKSLLPILEKRFPKSNQFYNIVLKAPRFPQELQIYSLNDVSNDSIFVSVYDRKDYYGKDIAISVPGDYKVGSDFMDAFTHFAPFEWKPPYHFTTIEREISKYIYEISVNLKGNYIAVYPSVIYEYSHDLYLNMDIKPNKSGVEFGSVNIGQGLTFFMGHLLQGKSFSYTKPDSTQHMKKILEKNESGGVYYKGHLVSANTFGGSGMGLLGTHYTPKEWRRNGFGEISVDVLNKVVAQNGFKICRAIEVHNEISHVIAEKRAGTKTHLADYIFCEPHSYG